KLSLDGPGCSASDRVSELNTSGRTGGRVLMLAVHHQSHFHLLIEASKLIFACKETVERWMPKSRNEMFCSIPLFWRTCSNVMELSELINENDFDDEPPTLTPSFQFSHWYLIQKPDQMLSRSLVHRND
ncbi:hypothetical protein EVAR_55912_1, partial [Eumeta japonica]